MSAAYDTPQCEFVRRFRHGAELWSVRFSSGGDRILVCGRNGLFPPSEDGVPIMQGFVWDAKIGELLYRGTLSPMGFSACGRYVASDARPDDPKAELYKVGENNPVLSIEGRVWFPPEGPLAIVSRANGVWEEWPTKGQCRFAYDYIYDPQTGFKRGRLDFLSEKALIHDINADGSLMLYREETSAGAEEIIVWDIERGEVLSSLAYDGTRCLPGHKDLVRWARFVPGNRNRVLTIVQDAKSGATDPMAAIVWDAETGAPIAPVYCGGERTDGSLTDSDIGSDFVFACSGEFLITRRIDGYTGHIESFARIFSTTSGEEVAQIPSGYNFAGAPDDACFLTAETGSPVVNIYNINTQEPVAHIAAPAWMSEAPVIHIDVAPGQSAEDRLILTAHEGGGVCLWRMPRWA